MSWILGDLYGVLSRVAVHPSLPGRVLEFVILMQSLVRFSFTLKSNAVGMLNYGVAPGTGPPSLLRLTCCLLSKAKFSGLPLWFQKIVHKTKISSIKLSWTLQNSSSKPQKTVLGFQTPLLSLTSDARNSSV